MLVCAHDLKSKFNLKTKFSGNEDYQLASRKYEHCQRNTAGMKMKLHAECITQILSNKRSIGDVCMIKQSNSQDR